MAPYQNYQSELYDNLKQVYHIAAEKYGNKTFLMQKRGVEYENISFSHWRDDVDALGTALFAHALDGKRILVIGENSYEWITAYMAVLCSTGVAVPVDLALSAHVVADIAERAKASAVIYSFNAAEQISKIDPSVRRIPFEALSDLIEEGRLHLAAGDRNYLDADIDPDAMAALIFTFGKEEPAKGVMLSHRNFCFDVSELCRMIHIDQGDTFLSVLPLHHPCEFTCGFLFPLCCGCTVAFSRGVRYMTREMRRVRPTVMLCVPLLAQRLHRNLWENIRRQGMEDRVRSAIKMTNAIPSEPLKTDTKRRIFYHIRKSFGGKLRLVLLFGGTADPVVLSGWRDLGVAVLQGYGLTECAPFIAFNRDQFYNDRSVGVSLPNALLDICDAQDDGIGEIRCKGEHVMLGYYGMPEQTAAVIRDGWFYTGDLGYMDADGFLYIVGRKKNMIVTCDGKEIFPEELEFYLEKTPYVKEAAVVGCYDPEKRTHDIVALIYPNRTEIEKAYGKHDASKQLHLEMKKAVSTVNGIVQPHKRITNYFLRSEAFPKNTSGKIKRKGVAEEVVREYRRKYKI